MTLKACSVLQSPGMLLISTDAWAPAHTICKHAKLLHSCLTLCNPMDCSPPGSSVHGILQARILQWVAISFSRGASRPRDRNCVSYVSCSYFSVLIWTSLEAQTAKNLPAIQETQVWSLGREDPLEKGMAIQSTILAWRIPWTEEPGESHGQRSLEGYSSWGHKESDMTERLTHTHILAGKFFTTSATWEAPTNWIQMLKFSRWCRWSQNWEELH